VLGFAGIILHHLFYKGLAGLYIFTPEEILAISEIPTLSSGKIVEIRTRNLLICDENTFVQAAFFQDP